MRTPAVIVTLTALVGLLLWFVIQGGGAAPRTVEPGAVEAPVLEGASEGAERSTLKEADASGSERAALGAEAVEVPPDVATQAHDRLTLIGRAVDERRLPVAGARAILFAPMHEPREGITDEAGGFRIDGVEAPAQGYVAAGVLVTTDDGRAGARYVSLRSHESDAAGVQEVGDVPLGPGRPAEVLVTDGGRPVARARVLLTVGFERFLVGVGETDEEGRLRRALVPRGSLHAEARLGQRVGRASASSDAPIGDALRVELGTARALEVLVVEKDSELPIAGAEVRLQERVMPPRTFFRRGEVWTPDERPLAVEVAPTGADGRTRVVGLAPQAELTVLARAAGHSSGRYGAEVSARVRGGASEVRLELLRDRTRTVRVPIVDGELPVPPEGTRLSLRPRPGTYHVAPPSFPAEGVIRAGEAVIEGVPIGAGSGGLSALAETPDGAIAHLWCRADEELGAECSFRRARSIVVHVEDPHGAPVVGAQTLARNQGNNELCEWVTTAEDGVARITQLHGGLANVHVRGPGDEGVGVQAGAVDLDAGDGEVRAVLRPRREVELRITVDGEPRLPTHFVVYRAMIVGEDPAAGVLRISVESPDEGSRLMCTVISPETLPERLEFSAADLERGGPFPVALRRAGAMSIEVQRAPDARLRLAAQRWNPGAEAWDEPPSPFELEYPNADDGLFRIDGLEPGRYRVRDGESGATSDAVEVDPRLGVARVTLDLMGTVTIAGRVVVPEGSELGDARVLVEGLESGPEADRWELQPGVPPNALRTRGADATFELRVPTNRPVTLRAWHPLLSAAADGGSLTIAGAAEDVVLRLEPGATCVFDVPEDAGEGRPPRGLRVLLFEGEVGGQPLGEYRAQVEDGRARFGGYAPGKCTLWIDALHGYQPLVLKDVELGPSDSDLGAPAFTRGSSIRFHVRVPEGQSPPRISAFASHKDFPEYRRGLNSRGEAEVVLSGLGAGDYDLSYGVVMGARSRTRIELTLDGEHDELIEFEP